MKNRAFVVVLALLIGGGALVTLGKVDQKTDLSAVMEMWGDVLRDTDQATLRATRVSDEKEMWLGEQIRDRLPPDDPTYTPYVAEVGQALVPYVRRTGIRYRFHVIDGPEINAFAIPGGHVFVYTGMLRFLQSEAELAAVLGHEMSHVDMRHAIERYQYELAARKVGLEGVGQLADLARLPFVIGYQKYEEIEADEQGTRLAIEAGYDPTVAPAMFTRMQRELGEPDPRRAATPQSEVARMLGGALPDYFRSHPPSRERTVRLDDLIARNRRQLRGKTLYVGVVNYRQMVPRSRLQLPGEERRF
jgi:predicted Zn-dependent protease